MPPFEQRLPRVDQDDGIWGDILLQYLTKEHYNVDSDNAANGGHKNVTIRPGGAATGTAPLKFSTGTLLTTPEAGAVEFNVDSLYFTITTGTVRKKVAIYDDSSGATGDLYYRNSAGAFIRLPIGADGKTLRSAGGLPVWSDQDAPSPTIATRTESSNYTINGNDVVVFANASGGNVTITLPAASGVSGYKFYVKRIDNSSNTCTVARSGSDTIDGLTSYTIDQQYTAFSVVSNGAAWYIL